MKKERNIYLVLDEQLAKNPEDIITAVTNRLVHREDANFKVILDYQVPSRINPEDMVLSPDECRYFLNSDMSVEAGCDEAGRGCLAGPVFAAAVVLPDGFYHPLLNDSKQMSEAQRGELRCIIERDALAWSVVSVDAKEIDEINILNASIVGMQRALSSLKTREGEQYTPEMIFIDGNKFKPYRSIPYRTVVKGDAKMLCIAAASVLAKTHRDEYMKKLAEEYPHYGWERNVGYPTKEHRTAIAARGVTPYHRMSYKLLNEELGIIK